MEIPERFAHAHSRSSLGEPGDRWLRDLPALVADLSDRWEHHPRRRRSTSPTTTSREPAAATAPRPSSRSARPGKTASSAARSTRCASTAARAACRLLESDVERQAMLLERLRPGEMLREVAAEDDDAATRIGADVMRRLWRPAADLPDPGLFKPLAEWFDAPSRATAPTTAAPARSRPPSSNTPRPSSPTSSPPRPATCCCTATSTTTTSSPPSAAWLAIDPKGMLGDPGYEVGPFLLNPDIGTTGQEPRPARPPPRRLRRRAWLRPPPPARLGHRPRRPLRLLERRGPRPRLAGRHRRRRESDRRSMAGWRGCRRCASSSASTSATPGPSA